ncbi:MAG TPA: TetR/AcrR family transcriptional regulator [Caulifigura sp.]|jgi:AcrR family transcriptional regulator|nr:TetR/AcrR family transcriptional regulator [Caulifigura sp.]
MGRPRRTNDQRATFLPIVSRAFSELGYRRTTTSQLAARCGVRENILYRLWPDKKAMFVAAIDDVFARRAETWKELLERAEPTDEPAARLIAFEAAHQGEFGLYRIVFTALAECDDPDIRAALTRMYRGFHDLVTEHTGRKSLTNRGSQPGITAADGAWGLLGLATISNIIRELKLMPARKREAMFTSVASALASNIRQDA